MGWVSASWVCGFRERPVERSKSGQFQPAQNRRGWYCLGTLDRKLNFKALTYTLRTATVLRLDCATKKHCLTISRLRDGQEWSWRLLKYVLFMYLELEGIRNFKGSQQARTDPMAQQSSTDSIPGLPWAVVILISVA